MAMQPDRTVNVGAVTKLIVAYRNGQTSANGLGLKTPTTFYLHVNNSNRPDNDILLASRKYLNIFALLENQE